jgi:CO dehydrogenase maturation factor
MVPVLAVDADANANFHQVLGLSVSGTLGDIREEMKKGLVPSGMTKDTFIEMKVGQSVTEAAGFDLLVMGRPEGPGCYCAANNLLAAFLEKLSKNYRYVVVDNEAGMEHVSRLTIKNADLLLTVSDPSARGIEAAGRIERLAESLNIRAARSRLIVNRARGELSEALLSAIRKEGLCLAGTIPEDPGVYEYDVLGRPTFELPDDSPSVRAAFDIFEKLLL